MPAKDAKDPSASPPSAPMGLDYLLAILAGWLLPGAGHWLRGQRVRAVVLCASLVGFFWLGQYLANFRAVSRAVHPIFFCTQIGNGLSTLISESCWGAPHPVDKRSQIDRTLTANHSTGILFTAISGLLNLLLILSLVDTRDTRAGTGVQVNGGALKQPQAVKGEGG